MIKLIPFGDVPEDRFRLSKEYKLIEPIAGIWRLTKKCKDNYEEESYFHYLRGKIDKPTKINKDFFSPPQELKPVITRRSTINELLNL